MATKTKHRTKVSKFLTLSAIVTFSLSLVAIPSESAEASTACTTSLTANPASWSADPRPITSKDELVWLSLNATGNWDKNYVQTGDIDLLECDWTPLGNSVDPFVGSYDGAGNSIRGLSVVGNSNFVGFFGNFQGTRITGLNIVDGSVSGGDMVGGIVGDMRPPFAPATISKSSFSGSVSGTGDYVGGIVGDPNSNVTILYSYANATVTGAAIVGGIVGYDDATISHSYFRGTVIGNATDPDIAGIAGYSTSVNKVYSAATISFSGSNLYARGLVASSPAGSTDSFWDSTQAPGIDQSQLSAGTPRTSSQMKLLSTYSDAGWAINSGWNTFTGPDNGVVVQGTHRVWGICSSVNEGYPFLLWEYTVDPCGGSGSGSGESGSSTAARQLAATGHDAAVSLWVGALSILLILAGTAMLVGPTRSQ